MLHTYMCSEKIVHAICYMYINAFALHETMKSVACALTAILSGHSWILSQALSKYYNTTQICIQLGIQASQGYKLTIVVTSFISIHKLLIFKSSDSPSSLLYITPDYPRKFPQKPLTNELCEIYCAWQLTF